MTTTTLKSVKERQKKRLVKKEKELEKISKNIETTIETLKGAANSDYMAKYKESIASLVDSYRGLKDEDIKTLEEETLKTIEKYKTNLNIIEKLKNPEENLTALKEIKEKEKSTGDFKLDQLIEVAVRNSEIIEFQEKFKNAVEAVNQEEIEAVFEEMKEKEYIISEEIVESGKELLTKFKEDPEFASANAKNNKKGTKKK